MGGWWGGRLIKGAAPSSSLPLDFCQEAAAYKPPFLHPRRQIVTKQEIFQVLSVYLTALQDQTKLTTPPYPLVFSITFNHQQATGTLRQKYIEKDHFAFQYTCLAWVRGVTWNDKVCTIEKRVAHCVCVCVCVLRGVEEGSG